MTAAVDARELSAPGSSPTAPSTGAVWGALLIVYLVWGSTYLAIRVMVGTIPPLLGTGARFILAALILTGFLATHRERSPRATAEPEGEGPHEKRTGERPGLRAIRVTRRQLLASGLVGLLLLLCGNGGVVIAERTVPSGLAALLVAAVPLWVIVLRLLVRERVQPLSVLGTLIGFGGLVILVQPRGHEGDLPLGGVLILLGGTLCWATGSYFSARLPMPGDPLVVTVWEMLFGGTAAVLLGLALGEGAELDLDRITPQSWLALAYLLTFGSVLAFTAYVWLLQHAPISLTSTYAYVNPVIAVFLGALVLGEEVTPAILLGGAVVVLGVALIVTAERPRRATARVPRRRRRGR